MRIFNPVGAALVALVLVGCEGDARPFEEAVEVRTENLTSIAVVPPAITVERLVMNIGESVQFGVQGTTVAGPTLTLDASDRNWQVTNESAASINDDGLLVAKADGEVGVFLSIGGLVAEAYNLTVSDQPLTGIREIIGEPVVERCLPSDYQATGEYLDGSIRDLIGVNWTLSPTDTEIARALNNPDTTVTVTGLNTGAVTLTAELDGFSAPLSIEVSNSLLSLEISPTSGSVEVDDVATFAAFGTYVEADTDADGNTLQREENVTESVDWKIESGTTYASVSNIVGERGEVTGLEAGTATLSANCGNLPSSRISVVVSDSSDADSDGLSFLQGDSESLVAGGSSILLRVSTGSVFDAENELEQDDLTWVLSLDDTSDPAISLQDEDSGTNAGLITPLAVGSATVRVTDEDGSTASIRIEVTLN